MPNCGEYINTKEIYFFGGKAIACLSADRCPNGICGTIGEEEYSLCKTRGQTIKTNLEILSAPKDIAEQPDHLAA